MLRNIGVVIWCLLLALALPSTAYAATVPQFTVDGPLTSDSGYFLVNWRASGSVALEVMRSDSLADASGGIKTLYSGTNNALFVSGLDNGEYLLRLRSENGQVSEHLHLSVAHQSLNRALWLAAMGAIIFLATVFTIFRGARDD